MAMASAPLDILAEIVQSAMAIPDPATSTTGGAPSSAKPSDLQDDTEAAEVEEDLASLGLTEGGQEEAAFIRELLGSPAGNAAAGSSMMASGQPKGGVGTQGKVNITNSISQLQSELASLEENFVSTLSSNYSQPLSNLHTQILTAGQLLGNMETYLTGFQTDLSKMSGEIESVQKQSEKLACRLKNRVAIQKSVKSLLDGLYLTPQMIKCIFDQDPSVSGGGGDSPFVSAVHDLNYKLHFVHTHASQSGSSSGNNIKALKEVVGPLETLRVKAAEKIRSYFMDKIKMLALSNVNVSILQRTCFFKNKTLFHFLLYRSPEIAEEIRSAYTETMSTYYLTRFTKYLARMTKLQSVYADKNDLIGAEDLGKKSGASVLSFGTGKSNILKDKASVYTLGDRLDILNTLEEAHVILPHVAEEQQIKYPYESVFRSMVRTLMDNASSEFVLALDLFSPPVYKGEKSPLKQSASSIASRFFNEIFEKTTKTILDSIRPSVETSLDAIGLLLCIRVTTKHQRMMQARKIPCLDQFLNSLLLLLWPRFQSVIDLHIASIKQRTGISGGSGVFSAAAAENTPHYITRRFAEFSCSVLVLNEGYNDNLLDNSILRLRHEVEALLLKMAFEIHDSSRKTVFLINNYDLIMSIFETLNIRSIESERLYFQNKLEEKFVQYVDDQLLPKISLLVSFVVELEQLTDVSPDVIPNSRFEEIALFFNSNWRNILADINATTVQSFSNFRNGSMILHMGMKEIIFYYQRFIALWEKRYQMSMRGASVSVIPVSVHELVTEIRTKYKSNFQ